MSLFRKKFHFKNNHVFITGAASGIGRQLSKDFYFKEHCHLTILDKNLKGLEILKKDLEDVGNPSHRSQKIKILHCDLSSKKNFEKAIEEIADHPLDILINNAGVTYSGLFEKSKIEDFETVIETNLMGTVRLTKALLPKLLESKNGAIVNISSLGGLIGMPGMVAYSTSKFGVVGFSEALSLELKDRVAVCTICPAFVKTQIASHSILGPLSHGEGEDDRVHKMNRIVKKFGSNPEKASHTIIQAIVHKKKLTLINPDAHAFYLLKKFVPSFNDSLIYRVYKKLMNQGVFHP
ncbi:MAG: SDR family NAD(P)-dependent oxidoreductase [Deltaproteobacteria bacterium]|nr:SDR family NAD(P)-dependent oxidoreductase [Deltaproteobacteria bacterium]